MTQAKGRGPSPLRHPGTPVDLTFEKISNKRKAREKCQFKGSFPSQTRVLCLLSQWNLHVQSEDGRDRCGQFTTEQRIWTACVGWLQWELQPWQRGIALLPLTQEGRGDRWRYRNIWIWRAMRQLTSAAPDLFSKGSSRKRSVGVIGHWLDNPL